MDISPIQRLAITTNHAASADAVRAAVRAATPPQDLATTAEDHRAGRDGSVFNTRVAVAWHSASVGYVTRVIHEHSGSVVYESPPETVLDMVVQVIKRLEAAA